MKIVNLATFLTMPAGTAYCKFEPCVFGSIEIKGESWEHDFLSESLALYVEGTDYPGGLEINLGTEFRFDECQTSRDGLFDDDQLYAVFDKQDVEQVIARLQKCLEPLDLRDRICPKCNEIGGGIVFYSTHRLECKVDRKDMQVAPIPSTSTT